MPVPEYKVESLYLGTKVGIRSLCAHRFCYLILRTSSALYSLLRSCIKMASDKAKCSIYVQSHIYGNQGVNATNERNKRTEPRGTAPILVTWFLRQFFLLQNYTCFTKLCRPGVSKCDRCAMDLVLQSAMIIRNCDITAFGTNFSHSCFAEVVSTFVFLLCPGALFW